jgi:elongation factor G
MKVYDAGSIRNVAVVGHGGCGKTQLVSTLLFAAGAVNRIGRVDEGTTVTDFDDEEIARKHTLSSSLAYAEWQKTKINFIDTPGFANFLTDARSALRVVEAAVVVVDAVSGVEVQTEKLWSESASLGLPRIVVLNKLDRERASLDRALESLRRDCAREIIPVQLPLGEEKAFIGVVDLVKMKAQTFAADGKMTETDIPATLTDAAQHAREQLIEMVAEADEQLMETFFVRRRWRASCFRCCAHRQGTPSPCNRCSMRSSTTRRRLPNASSTRSAKTEPRRQRRRQIRRHTRRSSGRQLLTRSPAESRCFASCRARSNPIRR